MRILTKLRLFCLCCLALSPGVSIAQFNFTTSETGVTITAYTGRDAVVRIPAKIQGLPVTAIDHYAFYYNSNVLSVTIPDGVTTIGDGAFLNCPRLALVRLGNGLANIGSDAFCNTRLHRITLPAAITNIGAGAFDGCTRLNSFKVDSNNEFFSSSKGVLFNKAHTVLLKFPDGREGKYTIPSEVVLAPDSFADCKLTSIQIPGTLTTIPDNAFYGCAQLKAITIPESVMTIGYDAFSTCPRLRSVTIPGSVTNIGTGAFQACTSLKNVEIMEGVLTIGDYAFADTHLRNIALPATLSNIGSEAFGSDNALTAVYFKGDAPVLGSYAFDVSNVILYHLANTAGWDSFYSEGHPVQIWSP